MEEVELGSLLEISRWKNINSKLPSTATTNNRATSNLPVGFFKLSLANYKDSHDTGKAAAPSS
jgi:hypothetical protein